MAPNLDYTFGLEGKLNTPVSSWTVKYFLESSLVNLNMFELAVGVGVALFIFSTGSLFLFF